jgi:hypothetical protein
MIDLWILVFVFRGVIAAAGDTMSLTECEARARASPGEVTQHAVCINVQSPTCRVYIEDKAVTRDITARCRKRVDKNGAAAPELLEALKK